MSTREEWVTHRGAQIYVLRWRGATNAEIEASVLRAKKEIRVPRPHRILHAAEVDDAEPVDIGLLAKLGTFMFGNKRFVGRFMIACAQPEGSQIIMKLSSMIGGSIIILPTMKAVLDAITAPPKNTP